MPTFTTIALENLLEQDSSSYAKAPKSADTTKRCVSQSSDFDASDNRNEERTENGGVSYKHIYISPALYTTPEPAPIPEVSPGYPSSPSPYVVNHKRRGGGNRERIIGGFEIPGVAQPAAEEKEGSDFGEENEVIEDKFLGMEVENEGSFGEENGISQFLDPLGGSNFEMDSVGVNEVGKSSKRAESHSFISAQNEFFDAIEEFSSDGSFSSGQLRGHSVESEIRPIRFQLLEEIELRRAAEDKLKLMQNQWQRISDLLAHVGLALPALPIADDESLEQLTQEVIVTKFVAEAVGKGVARAEAELVSQTILESKEQEISRLRDRLQYYEAVNLEMSQRNQEIVEATRKKRLRRRRRRKWLWSCIGLSVAIGATMIASSYLPATGKEPKSLNVGDPVGGSTSSETV